MLHNSMVAQDEDRMWAIVLWNTISILIVSILDQSQYNESAYIVLLNDLMLNDT